MEEASLLSNFTNMNNTEEGLRSDGTVNGSEKNSLLALTERVQSMNESQMNTVSNFDKTTAITQV